MITLYDPKTGQPVRLEDDEAHRAVTEGRFGFASDKVRFMSTKTGEVRDIPLEKVGRALAKGHRIESDEARFAREARADASTPLDVARAGLEGIARGATGGLSDLAFTGDLRQRQQARARKEENPLVAGVGEVAGTIGSLAAGGGGPAAAAKLGGVVERGAMRATGGSLLGRATAKATGAAAEGGLYGLGAFISEQSLMDKPDLAAEKLFAAMGGGAAGGAILMGGGTVFAGAMQKGGSLLMSKLGGQGLRQVLNETANTVAVRQHALKSDLKKMGLSSDEIQKVGDYGLKKGLIRAGDDAASTAEKAAADKVATGNVIGRILNQVDRRSPQGFDTARFTARATQEVLDPMANNPALADAAHQVAAFVKGYQAHGPGGNAGPMSFARAWELQSDLLKKTGFGEANFGIKKELQEVRRIFREEILAQSGQNAGPMGKLLQGAARRYRNAAVLENLAEGHVERQVGNRWLSPTDMLAGIGGAALGGPAGVLTAVGSAAVNHAGRVYGGSIVAGTLKKLAGSSVVPKVAAGLHSFLSSGLLSSPIWGGAFRATIERAVARGAMESLGTHVHLAQIDPGYLATLGLQDEDPERSNAFAVKADRLETALNVVKEHDSALDVGINRFLGRQGGAVPRGSTALDAGKFKEHFSRLEHLVHDTRALADTIVSPEVAELSPGLGAMMAATGARAVQFLYSVAPKPPRREVLPAFAVQDWEPSRTELARYSRYFHAVQDPRQVLASLRDGTLMPEHVDTLRAVYPKLLADLQQRMMARLAEYDKPLSFPQKSALSRLMGMPIGGAGDPQRLALIQQVHAATVAQESAQGGKSSDGRQKVSVAKNSETQAQRIEQRGSLS